MKINKDTVLCWVIILHYSSFSYNTANDFIASDMFAQMIGWSSTEVRLEFYSNFMYKCEKQTLFRLFHHTKRRLLIQCLLLWKIWVPIGRWHQIQTTNCENLKLQAFRELPLFMLSTSKLNKKRLQSNHIIQDSNNVNHNSTS